MSELAKASSGPGVLPRLEQAEAELEALRKDLDRSHQLATLGTLTAGIAHEVNNILTPVLAYAQLAKANPGDVALRTKALDRAITGVESAAAIIEAVLGFARDEDDAGPANIVKVIDSALCCLGREPHRDGITLSIEASHEAHVRIRPLALQQVLLNLLLNALSSLKGRRGELRIAATRRDDGTTQITVTDTGPGISGEVAETLFEPFVSGRLRRDGAGQPECLGGSGLGLAICKRLIEAAGGTIAVSPSDLPPKAGSGPGAKFTVALPTSAESGQKAA